MSSRRDRAGIVGLIVMCCVALGVAASMSLGTSSGDSRVVAPAASGFSDEVRDPDIGKDAIDLPISLGSRETMRGEQRVIEYGIEVSNPNDAAVHNVVVTFKLDLEGQTLTQQHRLAGIRPVEAAAVSGYIEIDAAAVVESASVVGRGQMTDTAAANHQISFHELQIVTEDGVPRLAGFIESNRADDVTGSFAEVIFLSKGKIVTGQRIALPYIPGISRVAFESPLSGRIDPDWDAVAYFVQ